MILGIGTDIVELKRITIKLANKILTPDERVIFEEKKKKEEFLGGRFAAKEAITKAFGSGIGGIIGFQDIEILPDSKGAPVVRLSPKVWERLGMEEGRVSLSISHTDQYAVAFALVESPVHG